MPIEVPKLDGPSVNNAGIAITQATPLGTEAFGSGLASGLSGLGNSMGAVAKQEQQKANLETAQNATIFLDNLQKNSEIAIKSTQGEAAFGTPDDPQGITQKTLDLYDQQGSDWIQKNTANPAQARYAQTILEERRNALEYSGLSHENDQKVKVQDATFNAVLSSTLDRIALYATDPAKQDDYQKAIDDGRDNIEAFANTRGWSQEQLDEKDQIFQEQAAKVKAVQMMHKSPMAAKNFIEENKETLGASYTGLKESVDLVSADQQGIGIAVTVASRLYKEDPETVIKDVLDKGTFGTPGSDTFDYKAFKVFEGQVRTDSANIKEGKRQNLAKLEVPIMKKILEYDSQSTPDNIVHMTPAQLAAMPEYQDMQTSDDPEVVAGAVKLMDHVTQQSHQVVVEQRAAASAARAERRAARSESRYEANQGKAAKLEAQRDDYMELYADPDKVASMSQADVLRTAMTLGAYGPKLIELHNKTTSPAALASVKVETNTFKSVMASLGIKDKGKQAEIQEGMTNYLVSLQQDEKRKMNPAQVKEAIGAAIQDVQVNYRGSFLGFDTGTGTTTKKLYEVENPAAIVIPPDAVKTITKALTSYGITDTPKNRLRVYRSMLGAPGLKQLGGIK